MLEPPNRGNEGGKSSKIQDRSQRRDDENPKVCLLKEHGFEDLQR